MSIIYSCTVYLVLASSPHFHCGHQVIGAVPLCLESDNILINCSCSYTINQFGSETVCNTFQPIVYNMTHLAQNGFRWQHAIPFLWRRTSFNLPITSVLSTYAHLIQGAPLELVALETRGECAAGMYMASTKGNLSEVFQRNQPARNLEIKTASQAK